MSRKGLFNGECVTDGCATTGAMGMSLWDASGDNDRHRCSPCNDAIAVLIPEIPDRIWTLGLVDRAAYDTYVRNVIALNSRELQDTAEPLRTRMRAAYAALVPLYDAAEDTLVRDRVATLMNSSDLLSDVTITNWWARHRYNQPHPIARG